jgi:predicted enzyme related to lactoylglutathione lyase
MAVPFGTLEYLYVGSANIEKDLLYYREVLGGEVVWDITGMGARVAAVRLGRGPLILLADHRPAPSCMPLYVVEDLKATAKELRKRGWKPEGRPFEIPNGPCYVFDDPSGNRIGFFVNARPKPFE